MFRYNYLAVPKEEAMKPNIRMLFRLPHTKVEGNTEFDFTGRDFPGYTVEKPVLCNYTASEEAGAIRFFIRIDAKVSAVCARCVEPVESEECIEKEYRISEADLSEEFPELPFLPDGSLDLEEMVYGELIMEVPGALLCSSDCAGLCDQCGKPVAECDCEAEPEGDPRLQILKQLLTD